MSNEDRDFRYMALNDLINDLQKNNLRNMDENIERKIIRAVLALMNDKNGEVQNLAVKWYARDDFVNRVLVVDLLCAALALLSSRSDYTIRLTLLVS